MTGRGQDTAVAAKPVTNSRWCLAFHGPDTFTDDLGSLGAWVGLRTGPDRRDHGEKEDYVLRRLLVAWREAGRLRFPFEISAATDDKGEPDFMLAWPDGDTLGVEVTEAGEEDYQAWLTQIERREEESAAVSEPFDASTPRTAAEIGKRIRAKVQKFDKGWYRGPSACDLLVYDNTAWGGFLDKEEVIAAIDRRDELVGRFRQIDLVAGPFVFLDLFGNEFRKVDVGQTYEIDYANWIFDQVERMRQGSTDELDFALIAEELESLGKSERRALASHLRNLLLHFLKCQFQPGRRGKSWRLSIDNARSQIFELLTEMPSLRRELNERIANEYARARRTAAIETELDLATFPEECAYSRKQIVDPEFYPGDEA